MGGQKDFPYFPPGGFGVYVPIYQAVITCYHLVSQLQATLARLIVIGLGYYQ